MGKDVNAPLRKAYITLIGGLTYEGSAVKVYDGFAPDSVNVGVQSFLYCEVKDQTSNDSTRTKNVLSYDSTILINIYYGVMGGGGRKKCDDIADMIYDDVVTVSGNGIDLSGYNLDIVTTNVVSDLTNTFSTKSHKVWVRSIRLRHQISEL